MGKGEKIVQIDHRLADVKILIAPERVEALEEFRRSIQSSLSLIESTLDQKASELFGGIDHYQLGVVVGNFYHVECPTADQAAIDPMLAYRPGSDIKSGSRRKMMPRRIETDTYDARWPKVASTFDRFVEVERVRVGNEALVVLEYRLTVGPVFRWMPERIYRQWKLRANEEHGIDAAFFAADYLTQDVLTKVCVSDWSDYRVHLRSYLADDIRSMKGIGSGRVQFNQKRQS